MRRLSHTAEYGKEKGLLHIACHVQQPLIHVRALFDFHKFILPAAHADFLGVFQGFLPVNIGVAVQEVVMVALPIRFREIV